MTRLDRLAENQLETALAGLEEQLGELRSGAAQFIGGASIVYYRSQTASSYDWTGQLNDPSSSGYGSKLFLVTATAQNMTNFWGQLDDDLYADTSTNLYDGLQYMTDYKNANSPIGTQYTDAPNSSPTPNAKSWFVQLAGQSTRTLWIKFYVLALDTATVTVTALT
jgi:hypothetical protein